MAPDELAQRSGPIATDMRKISQRHREDAPAMAWNAPIEHGCLAGERNKALEDELGAGGKFFEIILERGGGLDQSNPQAMPPDIGLRRHRELQARVGPKACRARA